jgi:hypothetical protein
MTGSILFTALGNKTVIELKNSLKSIWDDTKLTNFVDKRKTMESLIYRYFSAIDNSGSNTKHYKELFSPMSDAQFKSYFNALFKNPKAYLILDIVDYEHSLSMEEIEAGAKVLGIPLYEHVYMPHLSMDKEHVIVTRIPVPVGYINIKRTQQTVNFIMLSINSFNCLVR